jgi:tetratricopeptide (TPR) repeat protein
MSSAAEAPVPVELCLAIDTVCDAFEQAWMRDERPMIEDCVGSIPEVGRPLLLSELIRIELEWRCRRGEQPTAEEYRARFPTCAGAVGGWVAEARSAAQSAAGAAHRGAAGATTPTVTVVTLRHPHPDGSQPPAGLAVPGYEILGVLGQGGMGVVYKARQCALNRMVALKMILHAEHASVEERRRFRAEAETVARLQHRHIVQVFEVGEHAAVPYFSLEFCPGGSLTDRLDGTPWPPARAAELIHTLAATVADAHRAGIVHRDLKPGNVLLAEDGTPKIADFGLARRLDQSARTRSGAIMGTPGYMAPEQARGQSKQVGPSADVYALGSILYQLLTGRPPFKAADLMETLLQTLTEEPVPVRRLQPKVPRDLETICHKCLEKDPAKRYADCAELAEDCRRFRVGAPIAARPVGLCARGWRWCKRAPAVAGLLLSLLLVLSGGVIVSTLFALRANQLAAQANQLAADATQAARRADAKAREADLAADVSRQLEDSLTAVFSAMVKDARERSEKGRYREAEVAFRQALHVAVSALGEEHPRTAASYNNLATNLQAQGRYTEAEEGFRKALAIRRKALGENHPDTATSFHNLAGNWRLRGGYWEAEAYFRRALDIRRRALGEEDPDTAASYTGLSISLQDQGLYQEAEPGLRKALAVFRKARGDEAPDTATSYNHLGLNLNAQGQYAQAQPLLEKALAIRRKVLGEEHPDMAQSYDNVATNLDAQGQYAEAQLLYEKALAINRKVLGQEHPYTAQGYNNLAENLSAQGRYVQAQPLYEKALAINRKMLGEEHPNTAQCYNNLAENLADQGRYAQAQSLYEKALAIRWKVLGEKHPDTAASYNDRALNWQAQGQYHKAAEGLQAALAIRAKGLGVEHPHTVTSYINVAGNLHAQGRYDEAERFYARAADAFLACRLRIAATGLGRASKTGENSPLFPLAAILARNGNFAAAWQRFEQGLGRGTWDDLSAHQHWSVEDTGRRAALVARLERLDQLLAHSLSLRQTTPEQQRKHQDLLDRQLKVQQELTDFGLKLRQKYGPAAGQIFDREQIQAALPADAALVGWIDVAAVGPNTADPDGEHWAVLLRSQGQPVWQRLRGIGPRGAWTQADTELPGRLRAAIQSPRGDWGPLVARLRQQRLQPLANPLGRGDSLPPVRQLIVLPSAGLAGVPVELLAPDYIVSYALSGTLYAHLRQQPLPETEGLFALGDPVFATDMVMGRSPPLPPGGVLLTAVVPGGNAAASGLRSNDVLLRYAGKELKGPTDLKALLQANDKAPPVAVTVWRDGKTFDVQVQPGKLGVVLADKPASQALAELRQPDHLLQSRDAEGQWAPLPGTRMEVESLRRLFRDNPRVQVLLGSQASEQTLYDLAKSGELSRYRYLHLATNGEMDDTRPLGSALILSRDRLPDPLKQLEAGLPAFDGRLTAREVLQQWHLNADLVTLSACQTALGRYEGGEGFVGFAQALILAGSRSVCLSLWRVDDTATALLMQRFYANLLGKRDGLKGPMARAAALREAKEWLRGLSRDQALGVAAGLSQGVERGKGHKQELPLPQAPVAAKNDRPYAHPYYWAAFILIGDPG